MASVDTEGVVGGVYLSVRPGSGQALEAAALSTIPSRDPVELSELLLRGNGLLNDAQTMLKEVGGKLGVTLDAVTSTVSNVNEIAVGLKQGRGAAGMLLQDDKLAGQIRQTVNNTSSSVEEILTGVKAGRGAAGMLLRDEALANTDTRSHPERAAGDRRPKPCVTTSQCHDFRFELPSNPKEGRSRDRQPG